MGWCAVLCAPWGLDFPPNISGFHDPTPRTKPIQNGVMFHESGPEDQSALYHIKNTKSRRVVRQPNFKFTLFIGLASDFAIIWGDRKRTTIGRMVWGSLTPNSHVCRRCSLQKAGNNRFADCCNKSTKLRTFGDLQTQNASVHTNCSLYAGHVVVCCLCHELDVRSLLTLFVVCCHHVDIPEVNKENITCKWFQQHRGSLE